MRRALTCGHGVCLRRPEGTTDDARYDDVVLRTLTAGDARHHRHCDLRIHHRTREQTDVRKSALRGVTLMPCEHNGPPELIEMAERWLRERNIAEAEWAGS